MKKFISFVMAGAMVAALVPATAFAKGDVTATAKVVDALEKDKGFDGVITQGDASELQLKVTGVDYSVTTSDLATMDVELTLDKAEFKKRVTSGSTYTDQLLTAPELKALVSVRDEDNVSVLGTWRDSGVGATTDKVVAAAAPTTADDTDKIAELIRTNALPANLGFYKASTIATSYTGTPEYKMISGNYTASITEGDENPAGPDYATRLAAAWSTYVTDHSLTGSEYELGTFGGNAAYVRKTADPVEPAYVLVSALVIAPALKYNETDVKNNIKAKLDADYAATGKAYDSIGVLTVTQGSTGSAGVDGGTLSVAVKDFDKDSVTYTFTGFFQKDDKVIVDLASIMTKTSEGTKATVSVDSKMVTADDLVYASILSKGLKVSVKKTVDVAEDEVVTLNSNGLKLESSVGNFTNGSEITLKLNNGFEFVKSVMGTADYASVSWVDDNEIKLTVNSANHDEITLKGTQIEATSAKSGAVATITAKSNNMDSASCEVAKVVDYKVSLTVDEDEDIPVIYSGVDKDNTGITDDSDHMSLEVTAKESFPGAWSMRQGFNFNLPDGVYVTDVKVTDADNFFKGATTTPAGTADWEAAFFDAYQDGDHKNFEFGKRVFNDVDTELAPDPAELTFQLELVADPTFEGDVTLKFEGTLVDTQEVKIAKFVKPYTVKADQNDVIIDYRNTEVKTPIVLTEAAEGLLEEGTKITLSIEDDLLTFEDDPTFTVDSSSDMELKDDKANKGTVTFTVKEESDKAASVTISDMKLFMSRSIPAGAYDLEISTTMDDAYNQEVLFAADHFATNTDATDNAIKAVADAWTGTAKRDDATVGSTKVKEDSYVDDVCDYSEVVKEAFINVVTGGVDKDNMFTTKVVVPVGESYLVAGSTQVTLDAPAYVSAAGYTMLPVRAVSKALGVDTNNVLWNAETRTVTIMYSQRIITMTVGAKTIYVNGSAIPSSAAPEIKDGRTFLPLRDLGTALGVTDVAWDASTKTATLNGGTTTATTTTK